MRLGAVVLISTAAHVCWLKTQTSTQQPLSLPKNSSLISLSPLGFVLLPTFITFRYLVVSTSPEPRAPLTRHLFVGQDNILNRSLIWAWQTIYLSLSLQVSASAGPPTGDVVVSFPGCGTHLDQYYTQLCTPSLPCWEKISLSVVPSLITRACLPSSLAGLTYTAWCSRVFPRLAYDTLCGVHALHLLSSYDTELLLGSAIHSANLSLLINPFSIHIPRWIVNHDYFGSHKQIHHIFHSYLSIINLYVPAVQTP